MDKKPTLQVPQSPKFKPTLLFANANGNANANSGALREKFGFNGTNLLSGGAATTAATLANRDLQILQQMFKSVNPNMIRGVYVSKAGKDLKLAKQILTKLVEKRKRDALLKPETAIPAPSVEVVQSSSVVREEIIISSPEVSPVRSSKVVLDKTKSIAQKYSKALREQQEVVVIKDEPRKKRRLVRASTFEGEEEEEEEEDRDEDVVHVQDVIKPKPRDTSVVLIDDDDEEEVLKDEFTDDSDVDEATFSQSVDSHWDEKVLDFFNTADHRDLMDIAQCDAVLAHAVIAKRPFRSINQFESLNFEESHRKRKPQGELFSNRATTALKGYDAVDSLVTQCDSYSAKISNEVQKWSVKTIGMDSLDILDVDEDDFIGSRKNKYFKDKPKLLSDDVVLKDYQQVGINWLYLLYTNNLSCILADEMGLGKTCQVIAFLAYLKQVNVEGPHLIVVPSSTLENWMREFNKFAPSLVVEPYYGQMREREETRRMLTEKWNEIDVIVTTYTLATGKEDFSFFKHGGFNVVVYDEGHMLKNSMSERFQKLMKLKANFRLLLTGTPLQNNLRELMSLLEFILPRLFVSKKEDLKYVFNQKTTTKDSSKDYNPLLSDRAIDKAKKMMTPFILRRRKDQVLKHLPRKHHSVLHCSMTEVQREVYAREIQRGIELRQSTKGKMANILMALRKAAIHPMLFRYYYTDATIREMTKKIMREPVYANANKDYIYEDMFHMNDLELHRLCLQFSSSVGEYKLDDDRWLESGKVQTLREILPRMIERDGKVLIFSLFTQVLDLLEPVLSMWNIKFLRLDGSTSVDIRQDLIDKFYDEDTIPVFLLSTKAGGFGINLVCANNVIIFDQSFNPHDDKQAEDRAHRVGQTREVTVTRLIMDDTIEESMYLLAQNKLELDQTMSGDKIESKAVDLIDKMVFEGVKLDKLKDFTEQNEDVPLKEAIEEPIVIG